MSQPIVFISTHRIKEGKLNELKDLSRKMTPLIEEGKPKTVFFQAYLNDEGTELTFVHVFPDAGAMDLHFEGADERSGKAYEFIQPERFEIYGSASHNVMATMRRQAGPGIGLTVKPQNLAGFIRLQSG
jgi:hypothetical protein